MKSAFSNLPKAKFLAKQKNFKLEAENALFAYFWAAILKKPLSYLKSTLSQILVQKIKETLNLGPKMPYLGVF